MQGTFGTHVSETMRKSGIPLPVDQVVMGTPFSPPTLDVWKKLFDNAGALPVDVNENFAKTQTSFGDTGSKRLSQLAFKWQNNFMNYDIPSDGDRVKKSFRRDFLPIYQRNHIHYLTLFNLSQRHEVLGLPDKLLLKLIKLCSAPLVREVPYAAAVYSNVTADATETARRADEKTAQVELQYEVAYVTTHDETAAKFIRQILTMILFSLQRVQDPNQTVEYTAWRDRLVESLGAYGGEYQLPVRNDLTNF
jgi:hypothetical protein